MFRTKVNEDIRLIREEGAIRCLRNLDQYVKNVTIVIPNASGNRNSS